jgi:hypothetical protein
MTLQKERRGGSWIIQCDECQDVDELSEATFHEALAEARSLGYVVTREDGDYRHLCDFCKNN